MILRISKFSLRNIARKNGFDVENVEWSENLYS